MQDILLIDSCLNGEMTLSLNEGVSDKGLVRFRGKFQEAERQNKNKRIYPFSVLDENVKKIMATVKARGLIGELDHPTDSIVHFEKASHVITNLYWGDERGNKGGNILYGEGEILNTPHGKIAKALLDAGVRVGISSRGVGNGQVDENGVLVIGESYKLITFDLVCDPSCDGAFQSRMAGSRDINTHEELAPQKVEISVEKNKSSRIPTLTKEALIACLGSIVKQKANHLKARV